MTATHLVVLRQARIACFRLTCKVLPTDIVAQCAAGTFVDFADASQHEEIVVRTAGSTYV